MDGLFLCSKTENISKRRINIMAFFQSAVGTLQTLVVALEAGLGIWGAINLMEGYGNDNPGAKSQSFRHNRQADDNHCSDSES